MLKCQNMYQSFLVETEGGRASSYVVLHSFIGTQECDDLHNLKQIRDDILGEVVTFGGNICQDRMTRFALCETNLKDDMIIDIIVSQQRSGMCTNVYNGLTMRNKLWYHISHRWDKFSTTIGRVIRENR